MNVDQALPGVQIWKAWLGAGGPCEDECLGLLEDDERTRAAAFVFDKDRQRFLRSRAALRLVLGNKLDVSPSSLTFHYGPHGKPALAAAWCGGGLDFNLAHSGDWALIALASGRRVGVDLELIRTGLAHAGIIERCFSPREAAALADVHPDVCDEAFFRCWTRKEAFLKALGCGISLPLDSFAVSLVPGETAALLWSHDDPQARQRWKFLELQPAAGYLGAVVVEDLG